MTISETAVHTVTLGETCANISTNIGKEKLWLEMSGNETNSKRRNGKKKQLTRRLIVGAF